MQLYMIRHGATKGNLEHRYVGSTDEGILEEEKEKLLRKKLPQTEELYVSPMLRCMETAALLYPKKRQQVVKDFRECDFGEFEYKNYEELNGNPAYQRFIDSYGESGFPGGETKKDFQKRCVRAFEKVIELLYRKQKEQEKIVAFVVHGGTIMSLLDAYSVPHQDYFSWQVKHGEGFKMNVERGEHGIRIWDIEKLEEDCAHE